MNFSTSYFIETIFQLEIGSDEELTEDYLIDEIHPKKVVDKPKFEKPKGPPSRGAKRLTKTQKTWNWSARHIILLHFLTRFFELLLQNKRKLFMFLYVCPFFNQFVSIERLLSSLSLKTKLKTKSIWISILHFEYSLFLTSWDYF